MSNLSERHKSDIDAISNELVDIEKLQPTGSSYICDPPVTDTDWDYICLVDSLELFSPVAVELGWRLLGREHDGRYPLSKFQSYRKSDMNLIVTESKTWYDKYTQVTELAKRFNLTDKQDRVDLFSLVLGEEGEEKPVTKPKGELRRKAHAMWDEQLAALSARRVQDLRAVNTMSQTRSLMAGYDSTEPLRQEDISRSDDHDDSLAHSDSLAAVLRAFNEAQREGRENSS